MRRAFLDDLSPESRQLRFFTAGANLDAAAQWAADVDHADRRGPRGGAARPLRRAERDRAGAPYDAGAVEIGLPGPTAVVGAARAMAQRLDDAGHPVTGFLVQRMGVTASRCCAPWRPSLSSRATGAHRQSTSAPWSTCCCA